MTFSSHSRPSIAWLTTTLLLLLFSTPLIAQDDSGTATFLTEQIEVSEDSVRSVYLELAAQMDSIARSREERFEYSIWIFGILASVFVAVGVYAGWGRIDEMRTSLRAEVSAAVQTAALEYFRPMREELDASVSKIESLRSEFDTKVRLYDFKVVAAEMKQSESYSKAQLDEAMDVLRTYQKEIRRGLLPGAQKPTQEVVDALFTSARWREIKEVAELFPDFARTDVSVRQSLILAFSQLAARIPVVEEDVEYAKRLFVYAWDDGYGENALPFQLVVDEIFGGTESKDLLASSASFNNNEMGSFLATFAALLDPNNLSRNPSTVHIRQANAANSVLERHREEFEDFVSEFLAEGGDPERSEPLLQMVHHLFPEDH